MGRKFSPSLIGGFVLGAVVLFVGALFLFGSGDLLKEKRLWVTYFDGAVGALGPGAPVNFRGVRVGSVTKVALILDSKQFTARIPVYFEIEPDRISWTGGAPPQSTDLATKAGLRAKLSMQSLVTGQMQVELDLLPGTAGTLVGADPDTPEIASAPSDFDILKRQITEVPLQDLVASMQRAVEDINRMVNSPEMKDSLKALAATLKESQTFIASLNEDGRPLIREMTATVRSARGTSEQVTESLKTIEGDVRSALGELRHATTSTQTDMKIVLRSADRALQQARTTLASVDGIVAEDARSRQDIDHALRNLAQASTALRSFADTLERNPNAIIVGR
jgi:paraquat-inducible protein B